MFINTTQELTPNEVDNVVEMELGEPLEEAVKRAVQGCVSVLGLGMPSDEKIREALDVVKGYAPAVKKPDEKKKQKLEARYYGLLPEIDLEQLLDPIFANGNKDDSSHDFWTKLKADQRVTKRPHVTIVHHNSITTERELWDRCAVLHDMTTTPPLFQGRLGHVVWNGRVMAVTVEDFDLSDVPSSSSSSSGDDVGQEGHEFVSKLPYDVRERLHITVGTKEGKISAVEAKAMVEKWRQHQHKKVDDDTGGGIKSIPLDNLIVYGRIKGLMS